MGNVIYWKKYEEPKNVFDPIIKKSILLTGEYICNDERVDRFWMYGATSVSKSQVFKLYGSLLMKDGSRWESKGHEIIIEPSNVQEVHDSIINEAEQYLQSLKQ